jgi:hypothetical protein
LVQALAEGKTIEHSYDGKYWEKIPSTIDFLPAPEQYRIVQEPRKPAELLVWVREDGTPTMIAMDARGGKHSAIKPFACSVKLLTNKKQ